MLLVKILFKTMNRNAGADQTWGRPDKSWGKQQQQKGKGGKKGQSSKGTGVPKELQGLDMAKDGQKICFAYNLEGCQWGKECKRGLHICMKPGCGQEHSQRDHDKMKK